MIVYRIQLKTDKTCGAYSCGVIAVPEIVKIMANDHRNTLEHPTPDMDESINRLPFPDEFCGFNSAADLLRWFRGFIPDLLRAGYEIIALNDVKVTAVSEKQVLFKFN